MMKIKDMELESISNLCVRARLMAINNIVGIVFSWSSATSYFYQLDYELERGRLSLELFL